MKDAVRLQDAARQTGIPQGTIRLWASNGKIPTEKRAGARMVRVEDILARPEAVRYRRMPPGYVTSEEAARRTGYHPNTLCKMARDGRLGSMVGPGGLRFFRECDLSGFRSRHIDRAPARRESNASVRRCSCCGRRPVAPGFRLLCRLCHASVSGGRKCEI